MYAEGLLANDAEEMPARVDALLAVWASSSKDFFHCFAVSLPRVGKGPSLRGGRGPWARMGECGLEAPSPVFSFVYGSKRNAGVHDGVD